MSSMAGIVVGTVGRPWGTRGQFVLDGRGMEPGTVTAAASLRLRRPPSSAVEVRAVRRAHLAGGRLVLQIEGCASIEEARKLAGAEVLLEEAALASPEPGSFYPHQLLGLAVVTRNGRRVGTVAEVLETPGVDLLRVVDGSREHLVPFAASICRRVDTAGGLIEIDPPEGLLELSE